MFYFSNLRLFDTQTYLPLSAKLISQRSQQLWIFAKFPVQNLNWELLQITILIDADTRPRNMLS